MGRLTLRMGSALLIALPVSLAACGGGNGNGNGGNGMAIASSELSDPSPGARDFFGEALALLANGNIVVNDPLDDSRAENAGAVHLFDPFSQTLIASAFGDATNDAFGLVDEFDGRGVVALTNGNYVIASPLDDEGGVEDAGTVRLMNGTSGAQIGTTVAGDQAGDRIGNENVTPLANGNYVIASDPDDVAGVIDAGSVRLMNGATGAQIGPTLVGGSAAERLGSGCFRSRSGVTALANGNFVVASPAADEGGIVDAGSVRLFDGGTGLQIGTALAGNAAGDSLGSACVTELSNGNFVVASPRDDEGGIVDAGSVRLIDGSSGQQIGAALVGDAASDFLGDRGVTALPNGNFVVASPSDDEGGIVDAGSVRLIDGSNGQQIGNALSGAVAGDRLGSGGVAAGTAGDFAVASPDQDLRGEADVGSVQLVDSTTGVPLGGSLAGDAGGDRFGSIGVTALANGSYVVPAPDEVVIYGATRDAGGVTGFRATIALIGDAAGDYSGASVTALANGDFVVVAPGDDEGGVVDAGSVRVLNGTTGEQIGSSILGSGDDDLNSATVTESPAGDYFVLGLPRADNNGLEDSAWCA